MMSGYVTMASLHARLTGGSPLGARAIQNQLELMRRMAGELWEAAAGSDAPSRKARSHA